MSGDDGLSYRTSIPPRANKLRPEPRTVVAFSAGIVAIGLAVPAFIDSFSWSIDGLDPDASGWRVNLWYAAFLLGLASMIVARRARDREPRRGSRRGLRLAVWTVRTDIIGTCIWAVPLIVMLGSGL